MEAFKKKEYKFFFLTLDNCVCPQKHEDTELSDDLQFLYVVSNPSRAKIWADILWGVFDVWVTLVCVRCHCVHHPHCHPVVDPAIVDNYWHLWNLNYLVVCVPQNVWSHYGRCHLMWIIRYSIYSTDSSTIHNSTQSSLLIAGGRRCCAVYAAVVPNVAEDVNDSSQIQAANDVAGISQKKKTMMRNKINKYFCCF